MDKKTSCFFVRLLFLSAGCGKQSDFVPDVYVNCGNGSPQKAPAVHNLKSYVVSVQGGQNIQILN